MTPNSRGDYQTYLVCHSSETARKIGYPELRPGQQIELKCSYTFIEETPYELWLACDAHHNYYVSKSPLILKQDGTVGLRGDTTRHIKAQLSIAQMIVMDFPFPEPRSRMLVRSTDDGFEVVIEEAMEYVD